MERVCSGELLMRGRAGPNVHPSGVYANHHGAFWGARGSEVWLYSTKHWKELVHKLYRRENKLKKVMNVGRRMWEEASLCDKGEGDLIT